MDDLELPDDLKDDIEVIYLDDEDDVEDDMGDEGGEEVHAEVVDLSKLSFNKHTRSVFCCDLSNDGTMAITGGEDDLAYLWATNTGDVLLECTGHKDSVTEVHFNFDCQYVATGDMAGLIQVWSVSDRKLVWCNEDDDMDWMCWHPATNALCVGSHSGDVYIWQIPQGNCKVLPSHGFPTTCGAVVPNDEKRILVGYCEGQLKLWDIRSTSVVWQLDNPQPAGITSLDISADGTLAALAPFGTLVKLADGKSVATLLADGETEVECVVFQSELGLLVTGSLSGQLCVWEVGRRSLRHQARIECAVTQLKVDRSNAGRLIVAATDGAVHECDIRTGLLVKTLTGHLSDVLSLRVALNGTFLVSTSDDCSAKVFALNETP